VAVSDAERGARDRVCDAERPRGAAHERRLAGADLAVDEHHVTCAQTGGQLGAESFGLARVYGLHDAGGHDETLTGNVAELDPVFWVTQSQSDLQPPRRRSPHLL